MQNKLQELTDKLYNEGLSKGQEEANELLVKAREEANQLLEAARHEADQIISNAGKQADDIKSRAEADTRMAGRQVVAQIKQAIEESLTLRVVAEPNKAAFNDVDFIKQLVQSAVERFSPESSNSVQLALLLPADKQEQLKSFTTDKVHQLLNGGVDVQFSKSFKSGFRIGVKDKGYYVSFTEGDFENLFKEYLRPGVQNLIFGQ